MLNQKDVIEILTDQGYKSPDKSPSFFDTYYIHPSNPDSPVCSESLLKDFKQDKQGMITFLRDHSRPL